MHIPDSPLDSLVIGAGQAGLSASRHLARRGIEHLVLDANDAPGGAWQHRWDSLGMDDVHGIADLPDAWAPSRSAAPANVAVPTYFAGYEHRFDLPVLRPVTVEKVTSESDLLVVHAGERTWQARTLVNATGTWTRPFVPHYPGVETFAGEQRRPMFARIEPDGVRWTGGSFEQVDVILWATGFRPAVGHLAPLGLRSPEGGIQLEVGGAVQSAVTAVRDRRVQLVGYGPSASTLGANRAGRAAAIAVQRWLAEAEDDLTA